MKFLKFLLIFVLANSLFSCGNDDDICVSGEATPRMKMKFKTLSTGKLRTLDSLYVSVDYGDGAKSVLAKAKVDSALIPLRVDDKNFTEIYVKTTAKGPQSKFKVSYTTSSQYVSPACGIKKFYQNVSTELITPNPVLKIELNQTQIINEDKSTLYLDF